MIDTIEFTVNGKEVRIQADPEHTLLWVLRSDLGLTGSKCGCGIGACGACTVLLDREPVRSCQIPLADAKGKEIVTIEGLAHNGNLHPLQEAFMEHNAVQCGFCSPGMILAAYGLLLRTPAPSEADILEGMDGNLCRCGAHPRIVLAIQSAANKMRG